VTPPSLTPAGATTTSGATTTATPGTGTLSPEDEAAGRKHYKRGDELFKQGRFLDAAREFEAGYAAANRPVFLINIGHSYRKGGDLRKARTAYEEYLRAEPTSLFRPDVEDLIKSIDDVLSASTLPAAPPPVATTPTTPVLPPPSPPQNPAPITLAPPVMMEVQTSKAPESDSGSLWKSPWLWTAVGVVVVAGVAGTVYGLNRAPVCNATRCLRETD
jgi:tetratricopeptide (TPR) repeat protein